MGMNSSTMEKHCWGSNLRHLVGGCYNTTQLILGRDLWLMWFKKKQVSGLNKKYLHLKTFKNKNFIKIFGENFLSCHILSGCVTFHRLLLFVTFWNIRKKRKKRKKKFLAQVFSFADVNLCQNYLRIFLVRQFFFAETPFRGICTKTDVP